MMHGPMNIKCVAYVIVSLASIITCRLYKSALSYQAQLTVSLSDLVYTFFAGSPLLGDPKNVFIGT